MATKLVGAQAVTKTQVWVQLTTGGKPYPPTLQEMFLDPMFFGMEIWPIDQPASFAALLPTPPQPARGAAPCRRKRRAWRRHRTRRTARLSVGAERRPAASGL
jgi:hypothetical protein